jgi:hypothetical protein
MILSYKEHIESALENISITTQDRIIDWDAVSQGFKLASNSFFDQEEVALEACYQTCLFLDALEKFSDVDNFVMILDNLSEIFNHFFPNSKYPLLPSGKTLLSRTLEAPTSPTEDLLYHQKIIGEDLWISKELKEYLEDKYPYLSIDKLHKVRPIPSIVEIFERLGEDFKIPLNRNLVAFINWLQRSALSQVEKEAYMHILSRGVLERYMVSFSNYHPLVKEYTSRAFYEVVQDLQQQKFDPSMVLSRFLQEFKPVILPDGAEIFNDYTKALSYFMAEQVKIKDFLKEIPSNLPTPKGVLYSTEEMSILLDIILLPKL